MSALETLLACSFICIFAIALIAVWVRYLSLLIYFYRIVIKYLEELAPEDNILPEFMVYNLQRKQS